MVGWLLAGVLDPAGAPIVNGVVVPEAHPEVVAIAGVDPQTGEAWVFCSGSQVHFDHVLTAAHCIDEGQDIVDEYDLEMVVLWGGDLTADGPTDVRWVADAEVAPDWPDDPLSDLALVTLDASKFGVPWMVLRDEPIDDGWVGTDVDFFGFGVTQEVADDAGTKRTTTAPILTVSPWDFEAYSPETNLCFGDSGGPGTVRGEQIGINVGVFPSCVGGRSQSVRVDEHAGWLRDLQPEIAFDPSEVPDVDDPGRSWLDLGVTTPLDALRTQSGTPAAGGCSTAPGGPWLVLPLLLAMVRRRI